MLENVPKDIDQLQKTLSMMQLSAVPMKGYPNETADYFTKKQEISAHQ